MARRVVRQRRRRGSIDPDKILDGAFEVAERAGLDGLSMPELAAHLDVGVTSIYWYYRNKDDLLRRMSGRAAEVTHARMPTPADRPVEDWPEFLREYFTASREIHSDSELLTDMMLMRTASYSRASTLLGFQAVEEVLDYLVRAGFQLRTAWYLLSTFSIYTRGFILTERNRRVNRTPPAGLRQLDLLDAGTMPLLHQLVMQEPIFIDMTGELSFEFGIEALLDAAQRLFARDRAQAGAD